MSKFPMGRIVLTRGVYQWLTVNGEFYHFVNACGTQGATGAISAQRIESRMNSL